MVAVIVMNHSAMTLLILVCSSDMNTKIFLFRPRKYQYCQEKRGSIQRKLQRGCELSDAGELEEDKEPYSQRKNRLGPIKLTGKNLF